MKEPDKKDEEGLFTSVYSNRTRHKCFKLKEGRFKLNIMKDVFCYESDETLEEIVQRYWGFSYFRGFLGQAGWSYKQSEVVKDIPGHSKGLGTNGDLHVC